MRRWPMWMVLLGAVACDNPCQEVCGHMATVAAECGVTFSESEIAQCEDDFAAVDPDRSQTCATYGSLEVIRNEWSCDDINLYRDALAAAAGGGG